MIDPVMEALEETKRLERLMPQKRAEAARQREKEAEKAKQYTLGNLIDDLQRLNANPDMIVEAEGCDCTRRVMGVSVSMEFANTITLRTF